MCTLSTALMESGMEFQITGPATDKALSPNLVLVLGTVWLLLPEERSCQCMRVPPTGANISLIYRGLRRLWAMYISSATLNLMRWASGSQCSSRRTGWLNDSFPWTPLLTIERSFLLRIPQQRLPVPFFRLDNSQNYPLPVEDLDPHLIHSFFCAPKSAPRRYLDRFSRFCRAHERDQQTDTQTGRPRYSVCSSRPHLAIAAMRPKTTHLVNRSLIMHKPINRT